MIELKKPQLGLSVIESFIVVIFVGVVIAIGFNSYSNYVKNKRDSERQADIKSFHLRLEAFFAQSAFYPTRKNLNDSAWVTKNIKELTVDEMRDPKNTVTTLAEKPTINSYSYLPLAVDDTACDNVQKACVKYTLSATLENSKTIFTRSNLN